MSFSNVPNMDAVITHFILLMDGYCTHGHLRTLGWRFYIGIFVRATRIELSTLYREGVRQSLGSL